MSTQLPVMPVVYPTITAGGKQYQLRFSHGAWFQLQSWGYEIGNPEKLIPILALAAAACGTVKNGKWSSAGFVRPLDFADSMIDGETLESFTEPVLEALKKVAPEATPEPQPATQPESITT